jgi:hypothetical protein
MDTDNIRPGVVVAGFGFLGMVLAVILGYLNDQGILIDEYLTGSITLPDLQICVIIIALLVGVVVAILTSR